VPGFDNFSLQESVMTTITLRAPLRHRPAGLLERLWRRLAGGPALPKPRATGRPARLWLEALSDDALRDLGLPPLR
jgi:uncharacterized protein YjiS (DUF1127 family)